MFPKETINFVAETNEWEIKQPNHITSISTAIVAKNRPSSTLLTTTFFFRHSTRVSVRRQRHAAWHASLRSPSNRSFGAPEHQTPRELSDGIASLAHP